jgi:3,4-dihydroxy 2-butanone 4-phosphate synthase/GTP cyclohydrolase II
MARGPQLDRFATEHGLTLITVAELLEYRRRRESVAQLIAVSRLPTDLGDFTVHVYAYGSDEVQHVALVHGDIGGSEPVLVRVHSECFTGDVFASRRCDCGAQLHASLRAIADEGRGVVVYLRDHEGRGIGLGPKLHAYALQDEGLDTVDANLRLGLPVDARDYESAAGILRSLGVSRIRLLTNNPDKSAALIAHGFDVVERVPVLTTPNSDNARYLRTKQERLGHLLGLA